MIACQPATTSEVLERCGILTFCIMMAASLGLPKEAAARLPGISEKAFASYC